MTVLVGWKIFALPDNIDNVNLRAVQLLQTWMHDVLLVFRPISVENVKTAL